MGGSGRSGYLGKERYASVILKRLAIDRFGIWRHWAVDEIPSGLTVFFGPNETGKSTILEFLRGMFFGFASRSRFADDTHGQLGGTIVLEHLGQEVIVSRRCFAEKREEVELTVGGHAVPPEELTRTICPVDETTFNAVFALGLDDLAYLRTLEEGQTAALLYELSLGADRAALWKILAGFDQRLAEVQNDTELVELEEEHARLSRAIEESMQETHQYTRWHTAYQKLHSEIEALEETLQSLGREKERCEAILNLEPKWRQYREIVRQLKSLGASKRISEQALKKLDQWQEKIGRIKANVAGLRETLRKHEEAAASHPVDSVILDHAAEIEALRLHRDEIAACRERLAALDQRRNELFQTRSNAWNQLLASTRDNQIASSGNHQPNDSLSGFDQRGTSKDWVELRRWIKRWQKTALRRQQIVETYQQRSAEQHALKEQLHAGLQKYGVADPQAALQQWGQQATALRRIRQLGEQEAALKKRVEDVGDEYRRRVGNLLPSRQTWALVGSLFIPGLTLVFLSLIALLGGPGAGSLGVITLLLGTAMTAGGVGVKFYAEHRQQTQVETLRQELETLRREADAVSQERQKLSADHNVSQSDLDQRLSQLEQQIRELEPLAVLQAKLAEMAQSGQAESEAARRMEQKDRWVCSRVNELALRLGLPSAGDPNQALQIWQMGRRLRNLDRRLSGLMGKLKEQQERLAAWQERISRVARRCQQAGGDEDELQVLDRLVHAYGVSVENRRRQLELGRLKQQIKRRISRTRRQLKKSTARYRAALRRLGARSSRELMTMRQNWEQAQHLRNQAKDIRRELKAVLHGAGIAEKVRLDGLFEEMKAKHKRCLQEMEIAAERLRTLEDKRREVEAEIQRSLQSRQLDQTKLALAALEEQIAHRVRRRQAILLLANILERVRQHYELENQPETLQAASAFMSQMTEARYRRVWTPITERILLVEDATGKNWRVDHLSRGTREQLFLSLRLAIVQRSAEQGIRLPLILDDVLVNFDSQRAQAACRTLQTFAGGNHQVLLLTCHDHIAQLCGELSVPVVRLALNPADGRTTPVFFPKPSSLMKPPERQPDPTTSGKAATNGVDRQSVIASPSEKTNSGQEVPRRRRQRKMTPQSTGEQTQGRADSPENAASQMAPSTEQVFFGSAYTWYAETEPYADLQDEQPSEGHIKQQQTSAESVSGEKRPRQSRARAA